MKGAWNLYDKYTLGYTLDSSDRVKSSGLDFKVSLAEVVPKKEKTYVKFGITVQISKGRNIRRDIIFTGKWKYRKGRTVILEPSIGDHTRALKLKLDILDKDLLAYIEAFVREEERYIGGGLIFRW